MQMATIAEQSRVVVIGAGIVGLMTALEVQRTGRKVLVVEPGEPGGRHAASYGNAGWITNDGIIGMSVPGLWRKVPGYLTDKTGPFVIRWRYLPRLLPWLIRFVLAGSTWKKVERNAVVRYELCRTTMEDHQRVAAEAGVSHLIVQKGQLRLYRDKSEYLSGKRVWDLRRRMGCKFTELDADALHRLEPAVSDRYRFAVLQDGGGHCADLAAYQKAIASLIRQRGGEFMQAKVMGLEIANGRLKAVKTDRGSVECAQAVVAAGIGSKALAAAAGDRVPLESERGYHVVLANPEKPPALPVMPLDGTMGITPMVQGIRLSGQVEMGSPDCPPDWRRADVIASFGARALRTPPGEVLDRWFGERPSIDDGMPVIGPASKCEGLFYGFGHGHSGVTQSTATAKVLAALVNRRKLPFDISRLSVRRF